MLCWKIDFSPTNWRLGIVLQITVLRRLLASHAQITSAWRYTEITSPRNVHKWGVTKLFSELDDTSLSDNKQTLRWKIRNYCNNRVFIQTAIAEIADFHHCTFWWCHDLRPWPYLSWTSPSPLEFLSCYSSDAWPAGCVCVCVLGGDEERCLSALYSVL